VEVKKDGGVKVRAKKEELKSSHRTKPMVSKSRVDVTTTVVVGGGIYITIIVINYSHMV
jgi:hypothetical protein